MFLGHRQPFWGHFVTISHTLLLSLFFSLSLSLSLFHSLYSLSSHPLSVLSWRRRWGKDEHVAGCRSTYVWLTNHLRESWRLISKSSLKHCSKRSALATLAPCQPNGTICVLGVGSNSILNLSLCNLTSYRFNVKYKLGVFAYLHIYSFSFVCSYLFACFSMYLCDTYKHTDTLLQYT